MNKVHRLVIIGGGASGLELATKLGDKFHKKTYPFGKVQITLVDKNRTHIWKPKLHEVASGSMDMGNHELNYYAQAHWHHFSFRLGAMRGLNREKKLVHLAEYRDDEGNLVIPEKSLSYDTLIIALGSLTNDFGVPGVQEYTIRLESLVDAKRFHQRLINACLRAHDQAINTDHQPLRVAIIGAGATGVELAAELHRTTREVVAYGLDRVDPNKDIQVLLLEAAARILPALPERIALASQRLLTNLGVEVITAAQVAQVNNQQIKMVSGEIIPADIIVWAAGVKAPDFLKQNSNLSTNPLNQILVSPSLQSVDDESIFAMGDCAACFWENDASGRKKNVPPRAQAAHQQASYLYKNIERVITRKPLKAFQYRDFGSLVSLGKFSTVGSMMGGLIGNNFMVEGYFAKLMYLSLYKMHELALHGWSKVLLDTLARLIHRRTDPVVKLH